MQKLVTLSLRSLRKNMDFGLYWMSLVMTAALDLFSYTKVSCSDVANTIALNIQSMSMCIIEFLTELQKMKPLAASSPASHIITIPLVVPGKEGVNFGITGVLWECGEPTGEALGEVLGWCSSTTVGRGVVITIGIWVGRKFDVTWVVRCEAKVGWGGPLGDLQGEGVLFQGGVGVHKSQVSEWVLLKKVDISGSGAGESEGGVGGGTSWFTISSLPVLQEVDEPLKENSRGTIRTVVPEEIRNLFLVYAKNNFFLSNPIGILLMDPRVSSWPGAVIRRITTDPAPGAQPHSEQLRE
eukprot:768795-Hanusia_phi.AAC.1